MSRTPALARRKRPIRERSSSCGPRAPSNNAPLILSDYWSFYYDERPPKGTPMPSNYSDLIKFIGSFNTVQVCYPLL